MINQPFNGQLGTILKEKLNDERYGHFIILSAFAKNSGVLRIKKDLQAFRARGGIVEAFIGIDAHGTSYEAIINLFSLVDNLYIVHDSSPTSTFHSKVYYLFGENECQWLAIGSNNLTSGGLWTNYESSFLVETDSFGESATTLFLNDFYSLLTHYRSPECNYCHKIENEEDIKRLLEVDLLRHEIRLQIEARKSNSPILIPKGASTLDPFGTHGPIHLPQVKREAHGDRIPRKDKTEIVSIEPVSPSDSAEKMWFETRAMTGGSRNILDLSMLGNITKGSGKYTRYETDDPAIVLGSVVFFDIAPTSYETEKSLTINYCGKDYENCTIKYPLSGTNPNGSWRIQLKGETITGDRLTTANGVEWLVHKIIVLEKIHTDYYVLSVLPEKDLPDVIAESIFVARNGSSPSSKRYGLLNI